MRWWRDLALAVAVLVLLTAAAWAGIVAARFWARRGGIVGEIIEEINAFLRGHPEGECRLLVEMRDSEVALGDDVHADEDVNVVTKLTFRDGNLRDDDGIAEVNADEMGRDVSTSVDAVDLLDAGWLKSALVGDALGDDGVGGACVPERIDIYERARFFTVREIESRADAGLGDQPIHKPGVVSGEDEVWHV